MKSEYWCFLFRGASLTLFALLVGGCQKGQTTNAGPWVAQATPVSGMILAASPSVTPAETPSAQVQNEGEQTPPEADGDSAGKAPAAATDDDASPDVPEVYAPAPEYSESLEEIVRMAQSGISESVMLSYITNTTQVYDLTSEEIIYLNDLGISSAVIMALIEADNNPNAAALKTQARSFKQLPEDAVLTEPGEGLHTESGNANSIQVPKYPQDLAEEGGDVEPGTVVAQTPPEPVETYEPAAGEALPEEVSGFYEPLRPYGNWYYVPDYGYCWRPTVSVVNTGWRPYADSGRWLWTSSGWYWYSDYTWGWAPFHYGRWFTYPSLGWVWLPDRVWGPSWVSWRYTKYYGGWAPLPPRCNYVSGVGLFYNGFSVGSHFDFGFGFNYYTYIPLNRFYDRHPHHYYVSHHHKHSIHRDSRVVNNYFFGDNNRIVNHGVGLDRISRQTRREIQRVRIEQTPSRPENYSRREQFNPASGTLRVAAPPPVSERAGQVNRASFRTSSRRLGENGGAPSTPQVGSSPAGNDRISLGRNNPSGPSVRTGTPAVVRRDGAFAPSQQNDNRSADGQRSRTGRQSASADPSPSNSSPPPALARPQFSRGARSSTPGDNSVATPPVSRRSRSPAQQPSSSMRIHTSPPTPESRTFRVYPDNSRRSRSSLGVYSPSTPQTGGNSGSPRIVMPSAPRADQRGRTSSRSVPAPNISSPSPGISRQAPAVTPPSAMGNAPRGQTFNRPSLHAPSQSFSASPPVSSPRPSRSFSPSRSQRSAPASPGNSAVNRSRSRNSRSVRSAPRSAPRVSSSSSRSSRFSGRSSRSGGRNSRSGRNR